MKTIIFFISVLFCLTFSAQSTYIPMPDGYGSYGGNGFVPKQSTPFYESGGYIYCYTKTLAGGYYVGKIAKVNVINNQVTILSGEIPNDETPTFIRMYNGKIYFKTSSFSMLYQIDPTTNSLINFSEKYLGNNQVLTDYAFINNKLYFSPNGIGKYYDFTSNTTTDLKYYDTPNHFYYVSVSGIYINNNDTYITGHYWNETSDLAKIFKVNHNTGLVSLLSTTSGLDHYWFRDFSRIIKINNSLITINRINQNNTTVNRLESINLSNNTVNTNLYTYQFVGSGAAPIAPYIFNNMLYITDGDKVYITDGSSTPVLSNIPAFLDNQNTSLSPELPLISIANPVLVANNKVFGQRNYIIGSGSTPSTSELWITDGTASGTSLVKKISTPYQYPYLISIFANNSFYYHEKGNPNGKSYLHKTDGTQLNTYPVYQFGNTVSIDNNFYSSGKYLFYSTNGENPGLYKLDLSQLSQLSIKDINNDNQLILYPNPAKSFVTINGKKSMEAFDYNIMDLNGNIIKSGNTRYNEKIDIESLETGNYFIIIHRQDGQKTNLKLIKK